MNQPINYDPGIILKEVTAEAQRQFNICNACRYCEGFCPVFPDMSHERWFDEANAEQVDYLAHLCHNCTACFHACQYKPPHMYGVSLPHVLSLARIESFKRHLWPQPLAQAFDHNPLLTFSVIFVSLAAVLLIAFSTNGAAMTKAHTGPGAFYQVISHSLIVISAGATLGVSVLSMIITWARFASYIGLSRQALQSSPIRAAIKDTLTLKHLGGGHGEGCNVADEQFSNHRRYWHQAIAYGFGLCFAATCTATFYELVLGWLSPFPLTSLPVMLGIVGGVGLIVGPIGLLALRFTMARAVTDEKATGLDTTLCINLLLISVTGFALMLARETSAMGTLLAVHLALVLAFFVSLPFGKFVHAGYRFLALLKHHSPVSGTASTKVS